jgi:hypothetical protein
MPNSDTGSPERVGLAALRARDALDLARVAALADPASMARRFEWACEANAPMTLARFGRLMPHVPPEELRQKFERHMASAARNETSIANTALGVRTYDELRALTPEEFLARPMMRWDHRYDLVTRLRARGRTVPPALLGTPPGVEYHVLGVVDEEPDLAHVLYRTIWRGDGAAEQRGPVVRDTARRQPDETWRLVVDDHFLESSGPAVVSILDEEFMDLYSPEDFQGGGSRTPEDTPQ